MNEQERIYNQEEFIAATPGAANPGESLPAKVGLLAPEFEAAAAMTKPFASATFAASGML